MISLSWIDLATTCSKNGISSAVSELATHLKVIIKQERKRVISEKAPVLLPQCKILPTLVTHTQNLDHIKTSYSKKRRIFEGDTHILRTHKEYIGLGDRYSEMQPTSMPAVKAI